MKPRSIIFLCVTVWLISGCVPRSPIDAKKTNSPSNENSSMNKNRSTPLEDKDIFGDETTLAVSDEDIQTALEDEVFHVPMNSSVILVQSGSRAPEAAIQQEMDKYYILSTFSGIPNNQKPLSCNKDENGESLSSKNMNYMQALRYVAAKGHQKAIIVYQDILQSGKYDSATQSTIWSDFKNEKLAGTVSLRYLVRFTLVDVATGDWANWTPVNFETIAFTPQSGKTGEGDAEAKIAQLKQKTYAAAVKDLVNRFQ